MNEFEVYMQMRMFHEHQNFTFSTSDFIFNPADVRLKIYDIPN